MENTNLIQLLKCFPKQEFRNFGKFVKSPYHNNRKDVISYYEILKKYYPSFRQENIKNEEVFKKMYPGKKYNRNNIVRLNSYLLNLAKNFIAISNLQTDNNGYHRYLLKGLDEYKADKIFEKEYSIASKQFEEEMLNQNYFGNENELGRIRINYLLNRYQQNRVCKDIIDESEITIFNFIIRLVVSYHDMIANKMSFNFDFKNTTAELFINNFNFENFFKNLKTEKTEYYDYLLFYYYVFMSLNFPANESYYIKMKEYSLKGYNKISTLEKSQRFQILQNFCLGQLKRHNLKYLSECFNIYKESLNKQLYAGVFQNIDVGFFTALVSIGLALKEFDYIEQLILQYTNKLNAENRNDIYNYSMGILYFERKMYNESLNLLKKVNYTFPVAKLSVKHVYIKIYYETREFDSLFSLIDTYKHYINSDKSLTLVMRENHKNFLNCIVRIVKIVQTGKTNDLFFIRKELKENFNMNYRHKMWLNEKLEELERKNL